MVLLAGVNGLSSQKITDIDVEDFGDAQSAAEGAHLAAYKFQEFRAEDKKKPTPNIKIANESEDPNWQLGKTLAEGQNW